MGMKFANLFATVVLIPLALVIGVATIGGAQAAEDAGEHSITDLADVFSISRPTVYRTINRVQAERA